MAQDGYDYLLTADYDREREWMTEAIRRWLPSSRR